MGCGHSTIKFLLFFFNLIFALGGLALVIGGSLVLGKFGSFGDLLEGGGKGAAIAVIVTGSIIFFISFLGCCGAAQESRFMLISFSVIMFLLFIILLSIGIAMLVMKGKVNGFFEEQLTKTQKEYYKNELYKKLWDTLQTTLHCCGKKGPLDWENTTPNSCYCTKDTSDCLALVYTNGCLEPAKKWAHTALAGIGGFGLGIAFIQLLGVIFAYQLASYIKKKKNERCQPKQKYAS